MGGVVQISKIENDLTQKVNAVGAGAGLPAPGVATALRFDLSTMSKTEPARIGTNSEHVKESLYTRPGDQVPA